MDRERERRYRSQERHRQRNFLRVVAHLRAHPCVDCGESDLVVLDFDHLPGADKRFDIARAVTGSTRSWATIHAEILKCEVVCANCHRRRTARRANHRKHLLDEGLDLTGPPPTSRFRVPHGGGSKGRRDCLCDPCRDRRRTYARDLYRARRARRAATLESSGEGRAGTLDDDPQ
jgi:hypothetical protein